MSCQIESRNDLSLGAMLVIRFPEEEFDAKAFYTIEQDPPEFLVPFRCRHIDGQVECIYQLGSRGKLQYRSGRRGPKEYAEFWRQVLQPLLDCGDWFLKPFSFVLDARYLYIDRAGRCVSYLYVPSRSDCGSPEELRTMVMELVQQNPATDPGLENQTLRAIMQKFDPRAFLQMLSSAVPQKPLHVEREAPPVPAAPPVVPSAPPVAPPTPSAPPVSAPPEEPPAAAAGPISDDIVIDLSEGRKKKDKKKENRKKESAREPKEPKKSGGLFGRKKEKPTAQKELQQDGLLESRKERSREILMGAGAQSAPPVSAAPVIETPPPMWTQGEEEQSETKLDSSLDGVYLRLVGDAALPRTIAVEVEPGRAFTIGRFDVSVGHKQSDFEFEKRTKAVSRRHAAIERDGDTYWIVDLSSSAGTFVNGERLTPNIPVRLERGSRVSFGTSGADYVWEG